MPPDDSIQDPRAFRWVEAGVSGLARQREWDATSIAEVPSLRASDETELDFRVLGDGSVIGDVDAGLLAGASDVRLRERQARAGQEDEVVLAAAASGELAL